MTLYDKAKKLAKVEVWSDHGDDTEDELIEVDDSRVKYLRKPFKTTIVDSLNSMLNVFSGVQHDVVLYPGCATDQIRCILMTGAVTLIGVDLVDPFFYAGIDESRNVSERTQNAAELTDIMRVMTKDLKTLQLAIPEAVNDDKLFDLMDITDNKLTAVFDLFGVRRTVIVYVGKDVNSWIPPELVNKQVDLMFHSAYTADVSTILKYKPLHILVPWKEFYDNMPYKLIDRFKVQSWTSSTYDLWEGRLGDVLETTDTKDPFLVSKALLLRDLIIHNDFELWQLN